MSGDLIRRLTPEEEELERKQAELATLEAELAQRELDLTTLHAELNAFERKYQQNIGIRFSELDRIEAQIAEYTAYLEASRDFNPSDSLKKLYREVAKQIHPDLATNETERLRRQELMVEANQAYEEGNEEVLRNVLCKWNSSPESVKGEGVAVELIRVLRQISQSRDRIQSIEEELSKVQQTELYGLKIQVANAEQLGRDLLEEMAIELDEQIAAAQDRLEKIKEKLGYQYE
jgi:DnaJ-domain-containing protein 1